ncbi:Myb-like DNA-binding domain containing protein [Histomonas meleagridis]|uniref:Myb-like DNA-binding domain containing protein n=1 Tax=Histomonas meleagridis TaxID=135588 RepID=UPI00355A7492|nr:Myb-like DNA-binding domain containing protein [Histomonas meleagridis]KAH0804960.1 Myb-like DNA-binding domain containing protein [Histomonas meleagridis]
MSSTKKRNSSKNEKSHLCWTCDTDLSKCTYVRCLKCPDFEQCIECFSTAAIADDHSLDHPFMIFDHEEAPFTREDWTTEEDALLLFGIKVCGLDNWHEIEKIVISKSAYECETHYYQTYIEMSCSPLPPAEIQPRLVLPPPLPYDTTPRDSRPSISNEYNLKMQGKNEPNTPGEYAGWMPKRHEFEIEYINEAEEIISGITFNDETDFDYKLNQLRNYNDHLIERHRRTEKALEWGLLDREVEDLGGKTEEEKKLERELMPLAQVLPKKLILDLVHAIESEMKLKLDIEMLTKWLQNGILTHDEGFLYNKLMSLLKNKNPSAEEVEAFNSIVLQFLNSSEFRATLDRGIMSNEENELCKRMEIPPSFFLKVKDLILREFELRGELSEKDLESLIPDSKEIAFAIYDYLTKAGLLVSLDDWENKTENYWKMLGKEKE